MLALARLRCVALLVDCIQITKNNRECTFSLYSIDWYCTYQTEYVDIVVVRLKSDLNFCDIFYYCPSFYKKYTV